jgi:hypothetical protein
MNIRNKEVVTFQDIGRTIPGGQRTFLGYEVSDEDAWRIWRLTLGEQKIIPILILGVWNLFNWELVNHPNEEISVRENYLHLSTPKGEISNRFIAFFWRNTVDEEEGVLVVPIKWRKKDTNKWFIPERKQLLIIWKNFNCYYSLPQIGEIDIFQADPVIFNSWKKDEMKDEDWIGDISQEIEEGFLDEVVVSQITTKQLTKPWVIFNSRVTIGKAV